MIQTKLINILKQLPKTSAKETEKIVYREAKSVEKIVDTFSTSTRASNSETNQSDLRANFTDDDYSSRTQVDETPETSKKEPVYFDKRDKRFQYKDKDRETKDKKKNPKSQSISTPTPTPVEYAAFLKYNENGIFFKTNLNELNNRNENGSVTINIGDA